MAIFRSLPAELLGLSVIVLAALTKLILPEISDFWLAFATAITLFVIMQVRTRLVLDEAAEEKS